MAISGGASWSGSGSWSWSGFFIRGGNEGDGDSALSVWKEKGEEEEEEIFVGDFMGKRDFNFSR